MLCISVSVSHFRSSFSRSYLPLLFDGNPSDLIPRQITSFSGFVYVLHNISNINPLSSNTRNVITPTTDLLFFKSRISFLTSSGLNWLKKRNYEHCYILFWCFWCWFGFYTDWQYCQSYPKIKSEIQVFANSLFLTIILDISI